MRDASNSANMSLKNQNSVKQEFRSVAKHAEDKISIPVKRIPVSHLKSLLEVTLKKFKDVTDFTITPEQARS